MTGVIETVGFQPRYPSLPTDMRKISYVTAFVAVTINLAIVRRLLVPVT